MKPLDLRSIRNLNDESLKTRATTQLGAELKTAAGSGVSKEEKLTAGQSDQVDIQKTPGSSAHTNQPEPLDAPQPPSNEPPSNEPPSNEPPVNEPPSPPPYQPTIEYTEAEKAFLERMEKKEEEVDIWRQFWMKEFQLEQASRRDHFKNWLQYYLWTQEMQADLANERKIQSTKWSEAIGAML